MTNNNNNIFAYELVAHCSGSTLYLFDSYYNKKNKGK